FWIQSIRFDVEEEEEGKKGGGGGAPHAAPSQSASALSRVAGNDMRRPVALLGTAAALLALAPARRAFAPLGTREPPARSAQTSAAADSSVGSVLGEGPPPGGGSPRGREASAAAPGWAAGAVLRAAALALAVGVAASAAAARAAGEGAPASVGSGAGVFVGNCAACHAGGSTVMQPDKGLRKEALVKYGMYDAGMIVDLVKSGKNAMPAFGERLGEAEITDVAAYVLSQADRGWP
ncbi:unnamed protein product, partial [Prorocentrum cordatum]